jgi:arabinofuranosyltransferase
MDTLLFFIPPLVSIVGRTRRWRDLLWVGAGFLPFVLWEVFSITYYGFPFPNTAYAKLNTGIPQLELLWQGLRYFQNSLRLDPITLVAIMAALALAFSRGARREKAAALGIVLYLCYVLWIGGDFMSGRYFSAALLAAVILLLHRMRSASLSAGIVALTITVTLVSVSPIPAFTTVDPGSTPLDAIDRYGVSDERAFYFPTSSLTYATRGAIEPHHTFVGVGLALRASHATVVALGAVGYTGYFAGPGVHIIDYTALADPLLARLPPLEESDWRIGHFERRLPPNYIESIEADENLLLDPGLASYYDKLRLVIRGPVWDLRRFAAIWQLNTRSADHWLQNYAGP